MSDLHPIDPIDPVDPATERRIADAFGALLTAEVPPTAPRPQQAPRPVDTDRGSRRRRLQLAGGGLLAVAAAVVIALVVGTEVNEARVRPTTPPATERPLTPVVTTPAPSTTPTTPAPTTTGPGTPTGTGSGSTATTEGPEIAPTVAEVTAAFTDATRSTRSDVVAVPGGYEGADLDAGTIRFWRWDGSAWAVDGTSTYLPDFTGDYGASIRATALLTGMDHVTVLLDNEGATGDGSGVVIAYTDGADGWGAIVAGSDANLHPSGGGITALGQDGGMYEGALEDGLLVTVDCSRTAPDMASCGSPEWQVRKS